MKTDFKGSVWEFQKWAEGKFKKSNVISLKGSGTEFTGNVNEAVNHIEETFNGSDKLRLSVYLK